MAEDYDTPTTSSLLTHLHFLDDMWVVVIEVRLLGVKLVQVVLLALLSPRPGRAPEHAFLEHTHTWLVCLPLDPKVAGSNPAKAMDF
jgi:hypothetical protein